MNKSGKNTERERRRHELKDMIKEYDNLKLKENSQNGVGMLQGEKMF